MCFQFFDPPQQFINLLLLVFDERLLFLHSLDQGNNEFSITQSVKAQFASRVIQPAEIISCLHSGFFNFLCDETRINLHGFLLPALCFHTDELLIY